MPNVIQLGQAMAVAAGVAGMVFLSFGLGARSWPSFRACGWPLGIGGGFVAGASMLGVVPSGSFAGDQERLAFIVIPLITLGEALLCGWAASRWWALAFRCLVASSICPILLHGSIYMAGDAGAAGSGWTPAASAALLTRVGAGAACALMFLTGSTRRGESAAVGWCLGLTTLAAGLATMLSGYLTGGLLALPMAVVLIVACGTSPLLAGGALDAGGLSVGFVGLMGVLMIGHFFGSLSVIHALVLGAVPLLCCGVEMGLRQACRPWQRGIVALGCSAALLACVVWQAYDRFNAASATPRHDAAGTTAVEDYLNYGR